MFTGIPRPNSVVTIYSVAKSADGYGTDIPTPVLTDVEAHIDSRPTGTLKTPQGDPIKIDAKIHIDYDESFNITKGDYIDAGDKQYKVVYAGLTYDLDGGPAFHYLQCEEGVV